MAPLTEAIKIARGTRNDLKNIAESAFAIAGLATHNRTYNRKVRRFAAVVLMVLFASLNAIDGICCPDGCTHEQEAPSDRSGPQPTDGMCVLCVGGVDNSAPESLSPGAFIVAQVVRTATASPDDVRPEPPDHPPRL